MSEEMMNESKNTCSDEPTKTKKSDDVQLNEVDLSKTSGGIGSGGLSDLCDDTAPACGMSPRNGRKRQL